MPTTSVPDSLFLPGLFILIAFMVLLTIEGGYRLGAVRRRQAAGEQDGPVGAMVGSTLGLLAFMLAFTFGVATSRFEARKVLVVDEANAIGTTYLRAAMLPERNEAVKQLLRDYVDLRLDAVQTGKVEEALAQSDRLQAELWTHAVAIGQQHPNSIVVGLYIESLNEVIDLHAKRLTVGMRNRIPTTIWISLFTIAVLSLGAMGYQSGLAGATRSLATLAVAFAFSAVIALVADLDRPQAGSLTVSQQAMIDLQRSMKGQ